MAWTNLAEDLEDEFREFTTRADAMFMRLSECKSRRQLYPSKIWWKQKVSARRLMARANRTCRNATCRKTFTGKRSDSAYCSHRCLDQERARNYQRRKRAKLPPKPARTCRICSAPIQRKRADAVYCSVKCNKYAFGKARRSRHAAGSKGTVT